MSERRNQNNKPPLPEGWELVAVAYGSGKDDYLGVVLAYSADDDKYATWTWNSDFGCQGVGEGHYFEGRNADMDDVASRAWEDFSRRAIRFATATHSWAARERHGI